MVLHGVPFAVQLVSAVVQRALVFLFPLCIVTTNQMIYNLIFTGLLPLRLLAERYAGWD